MKLGVFYFEKVNENSSHGGPAGFVIFDKLIPSDFSAFV